MEEALLMFCVVAALLLALVVMFAALPLKDYRPNMPAKRRRVRWSDGAGSDWR